VIRVNTRLPRVLLFLAFFLSGCSGLIYQTVWVRMLTRYVGATTYATAAVLTVFMAGLALGSYLGGRYADRARRPLRGYALLELAIAVTGLLASFAVIRGLGTYYVSFYDVLGDNPTGHLVVRVVFAMCCLLPPTVLMGATLPLLVAFVSRLGQHLQTGLGRLYALNTFGAVAGVLAAGLVLIGEFGESFSLAVAAALNLAAALFVLGLRQPQVSEPVPTAAADAAEAIQPYPRQVRALALIAFLISGFSALAYEVLWTRYLILMLSTSIYSFSLMLGNFLVGIALGSWVSSRRRDLRQAPLASFAMLEVFIGLWTVVGLLLLPLCNQLWLAGGELWVAGINLGRMAVGNFTCALLVLPIAFAFGVQFPIAVRCCQAEPDAPGRSTGRAYAVNTLGTILGAMSAGFLLIPLFGTSMTMMLVAGLNLLIGICLLLAAPKPERGRLFAPTLGLTAVCAVLAFFVGDPYPRIMAARVQDQWPGWEIFRYYDGPTAVTIAAGAREKPLDRALLVNGHGMTILVTETKLMAHLPYHLVGAPKRMLVICFGMGTTYRSACLYPDLRVNAVDIVPEVFNCFGEFHPDAERWRNRPNAFLHADDGRNYLLTHPDKYDIITIDPAPPLHSAGSVNLYTKEFFQLGKDRLTPGGALSMWLPPVTESEMLMIMRSFVEVFPDATLWGAVDKRIEGFYLIGGHRSFKPTRRQLDQLAHQLSQIEDLGQWKVGADYSQPENLEKLYLTDAEGLSKMVEGMPAVTDDHPYTEFPLWRNLFVAQGKRQLKASSVRERLQHLAERK
jgi:spermidine synthase